MSHPHVLRFVGVCCEPPNLCIVAEFLPGGSVYDLLHTNKRLPAGHTAGQLRLSAQLALRLASDVASGMAYLHSQGIIHRDLKSANLLLDAQDRVKGARDPGSRTRARTVTLCSPRRSSDAPAPRSCGFRGCAPHVLHRRDDGRDGHLPLDGS